MTKHLDAFKQLVEQNRQFRMLDDVDVAPHDSSVKSIGMQTPTRINPVDTGAYATIILVMLAFAIRPFISRPVLKNKSKKSKALDVAEPPVPQYMLINHLQNLILFTNAYHPLPSIEAPKPLMNIPNKAMTQFLKTSATALKKLNEHLEHQIQNAQNPRYQTLLKQFHEHLNHDMKKIFNTPTWDLTTESIQSFKEKHNASLNIMKTACAEEPFFKAIYHHIMQFISDVYEGLKRCLKGSEKPYEGTFFHTYQTPESKAWQELNLDLSTWYENLETITTTPNHS